MRQCLQYDAGRLTKALHYLLPDGLKRPPSINVRALSDTESEAGPHVFVAMPFSDEFDDIYHYAIEPAVRAAGFLCERADTCSFSGDILDWLKGRIRTAALVIADLSTANPNVYLEVGYAWGFKRPTILLTSDPNDLKFDVRGQRCVIYKRIRDLEENLKRELGEMVAALGNK